MSQGDEQLDDLLQQDPELAASFIAEAREHLESIEDDFLRLEEQQGNPDPDLVNNIFRAIHSVKGSAGFLSLDKVSELSHIMETLLSKMRSGDLLPTSDHIDALLAGVDKLNLMLADIDQCKDVDISVNTERLTFLLTAENDAPKVKAETISPSAAPVREEGSTMDKIALDMLLGGSAVREVGSTDGMESTNQLVFGLMNHNNFSDHSTYNSFNAHSLQSHATANTLGAFGMVTASYSNYLFLNVSARNDWFSSLQPCRLVVGPVGW